MARRLSELHVLSVQTFQAEPCMPRADWQCIVRVVRAAEHW